MTKAENDKAIGPEGRTRAAKNKLKIFILSSKKLGEIDEWRRGTAILRYIKGQKVIDISKELGVAQNLVNRWLQWYEVDGIDGQRTRESPEATSTKLTEPPTYKIDEAAFSRFMTEASTVEVDESVISRPFQRFVGALFIAFGVFICLSIPINIYFVFSGEIFAGVFGVIGSAFWARGLMMSDRRLWTGRKTKYGTLVNPATIIAIGAVLLVLMATIWFSNTTTFRDKINLGKVVAIALGAVLFGCSRLRAYRVSSRSREIDTMNS